MVISENMINDSDRRIASINKVIDKINHDYDREMLLHDIKVKEYEDTLAELINMRNNEIRIKEKSGVLE